MKKRIDETEVIKVLKMAKEQNIITEDDTAAIFYDIEYTKKRISNLKNNFPKTALHTIAVKANPLIKILEEIKNLNIGLEVASLPELHIAMRIGYKSSKIVFDSPCKTKKEIEFAIKNNINLNADSFTELDRIKKILQTTKSSANIGIRINPQVGTGTIKATSVADKVSKFGIPIEDNRGKIIEYYLNNNWLNGVHVHIGSQGCQPQLLIDGIKKTYDLIEEINQKLKDTKANRQIHIFDIGGGLPVSYHFDKAPFTMEEYSCLLKENIPELFTDKFKLVTEFGRYIHANTAWAVSRVEYVKKEKDYNIAMTHLGADLFVRKCYNPNDWHHEITILDRNGDIKMGKDINKYIIAGPLCFAGDIIANNLVLPILQEEDYIIIYDIGAYTLSMWSRYNSREMPKILVYDDNNLSVLKEREKEINLYSFWK